MGMCIRLVRKKTKKVVDGSAKLTKDKKFNVLVTSSHITIILAFTVAQLTATIFGKTYLLKVRINSAYYFLGGVADLFLTIMMWFIFDENKKISILTDGPFVYEVKSDIIVGVESSINVYEEDAEGEF